MCSLVLLADASAGYTFSVNPQLHPMLAFAIRQMNL